MPYTLRTLQHGHFLTEREDADEDTSNAIDQMQEEVASQAFQLWNGLLESRIRVNMYRYMSGNKIEPRGGSWVVHDDLAKPYGPWLEGLGSRNSPVTRFPGYHSLSDAAEIITANIPAICEPIVDELCDKLNEPT